MISEPRTVGDTRKRPITPSRLTQERVGATPIGVFRSVRRPVYNELMAEQLEGATAKSGVEDLEALPYAGETWTVTSP